MRVEDIDFGIVFLQEQRIEQKKLLGYAERILRNSSQAKELLGRAEQNSLGPAEQFICSAAAGQNSLRAAEHFSTRHKQGKTVQW